MTAIGHILVASDDSDAARAAAGYACELATELHARLTLLQVVSVPGVDAIVMGTHGRHGVARWVLGSVAESVLRRAPCPVLTVHAASGVRSRSAA